MIRIVCSTSNGLFLVDPETGSWAEKRRFEDVRWGHSLTKISRTEAVLIGGCDKCYDMAPTTEILQLEKDFRFETVEGESYEISYHTADFVNS